MSHTSKAILYPLYFKNLINIIVIFFFTKLIDKKIDKVEFDIKPKTNEESISATYRFIRLIDSYRLLSISLDSLVKTLVDNSHKTFKNSTEKLLILMIY